jgi:tRNA G18 (ribose-2'-O)-methylase SpoU
MAYEFPTRNIREEYEHLPTDVIRDTVKENSLPYAVLALNVHSSLNISNMLRTAHLCGCRKFVIFGRRHYDKRSAVGVMNYLDIERVQGLANPSLDLTTQLTDADYIFDPEIFVNYIETNHYLPIFVEQDPGQSIPADFSNIRKIMVESQTIDRTPIFIFGNEHFGIPANLLATRTRFSKYYTLELNQMGALQSYNVSNTCAIICYLILLSHQ